MRFALCFSGQCRNLFYSWEMITKRTIEPLQKYGTVDFFFHFWSGEVSGFPKEMPDLKDQSVVDGICELVDPKLYAIEDQIDFSTCRSKPLPNNASAHRIGSMFYSIKKCDDLRKQYETDGNFKYDRVIRHRTDRILNYELPDEFIVSLDEEICVRKFGSADTNDQFAIGSSDLMTVYSRCYDFVAKSTKPSPEEILSEWLTESSVYNSIRWLPDALIWF